MIQVAANEAVLYRPAVRLSLTVSLILNLRRLRLRPPRCEIAAHNLEPTNGLRVLFYNEDETDEGIPDNLVVEGILEYDPQEQRWVAQIDWDQIKNISQLSPKEKAEYGLE